MDLDRKQLPVSLGLGLARRIEHARALVVHEHHPVAHEHPVVDADPVADERVALDLAVGAYHGAALDLDERADPRAVAYAAAVQVREREDGDAFAEGDV